MNGLKIQWVIVDFKNTKEVNFDINFSTKTYFAVGVIYNDDTGMTSTAYESQVFPQKYEYNKVIFGNTTSVKRRVFAIGY